MYFLELHKFKIIVFIRNTLFINKEINYNKNIIYKTKNDIDDKKLLIM